MRVFFFYRKPYNLHGVKRYNLIAVRSVCIVRVGAFAC